MYIILLLLLFFEKKLDDKDVISDFKVETPLYRTQIYSTQCLN